MVEAPPPFCMLFMGCWITRFTQPHSLLLKTPTTPPKSPSIRLCFLLFFPPKPMAAEPRINHVGGLDIWLNDCLYFNTFTLRYMWLSHFADASIMKAGWSASRHTRFTELSLDDHVITDNRQPALFEDISWMHDRFLLERRFLNALMEKTQQLGQSVSSLNKHTHTSQASCQS